MSVNLLTEHHLEFLSLKGGRAGSSESTHVKYHIVGNHMSRLILNLVATELPLVLVQNCSCFRSYIVMIDPKNIYSKNRWISHSYHLRNVELMLF